MKKHENLPHVDKSSTGPEPERLCLPHEDWEDAVGDALKKPAPAKPTKDQASGVSESDKDSDLPAR